MKKALPVILLVTLWSESNLLAQGRPPVNVTAHTTKTQQIHSHAEALGNLKANESVQISVNVTETISRINFDDGQTVKKGRVLVELTSSEERALLVEAEAAVLESKRQLDRVKKLVREGNSSQSLLDERQRNYDADNARLVATRARIDDRVVSAPFAGSVGIRQVSLGALVTPGDVITTLTDNKQMKLDFSVPAVLLSHIQVDLPIQAKSVAYKGRIFEGKVTSIDNQIDPDTRSFQVRAVLPNTDGQLKQGMLMTVDLFYNQRDAVMLPEAAVIQEADKNFALVAVQKDGQTLTEKRAITLGQRYQGEVEVLSGLSAGEQAVLHGAFKVSPGAAIKITEKSGGQ